MFTFLASILFVSMFTALVSAQDNSEPTVVDSNEEISEEAQQEIEAMDNSPGVEMRLLQLERAIERSLLHMNTVITVLSENGTDTSELEGIRAEMEILLEEVQSIESPEVNQETIDQFVQIREDGRSIVERFREASTIYITTDLKISLQEQFRNIERNQLKELTDKIQEKRKEFNANRAERLMNSIGNRDNALLQRVREGNLTSEQIKTQLRERLNNLSAEEKRVATQRIANQTRERALEVANRLTNATMVRLENNAQRLMDRAKVLERKGFTNASLRLQNTASSLQFRAEDIQRIRTTVQEKMEDRRLAQ